MCFNDDLDMGEVLGHATVLFACWFRSEVSVRFCLSRTVDTSGGCVRAVVVLEDLHGVFWTGIGACSNLDFHLCVGQCPSSMIC